MKKLKRRRRQTQSTPFIFIIPSNIKSNTAIFTIATTLITTANIRFQIKNNTLLQSNLDEQITIKDQKLININTVNGVVSSQTEFHFSTFHTLQFVVETLQDAAVVASQEVVIKLRPSNWDGVILTNQPHPLWLTIGEWNRPFDPIINLQSRESVLYSAHDVRFFIEHGDANTFGVDETTGKLFINTRKQFVIDDVYTLVISAQSQGTRLAASSVITEGKMEWIRAPSQVVNIKVGNKPPQFHLSPFIINFFENATTGQRIGRVEATSFQKLPLVFSMSPSSPLFSLDGNSGQVTLKSQLTYIKDTREYVHNVSVKESYSNFESSTKLIFRLNSANHPPTFSTSHYLKYNVPETTPLGTKLMEMHVREYDPGEMGRLQMMSSDDTFAVEEKDGKVSLTLARNLNYESLRFQRYDVVISAIDHGWPRLTGTTSVQIFVDNSNDKSPVFEPENQIVTIQEGAPADLVVHYIQAYDPDGDGITFNFNPDSQAQDYFKVDSNTGKITLKKSIEPGVNAIVFFNLSISITDDSKCCPNQPFTPTHTTQGFIEVKVQRVNTQPTFPNCRQYKLSVKEGEEPNDKTNLTLMAKDNDSGTNGLLKFRIFGEEKNYFSVRQRSANEVDLYLTQKIGRESAGVMKFNDTFKYPVFVKAVDQGTPALSVNCFLFVDIETINLEAPRFDYDEQNANFYVTSASSGNRIVRVFAFDRDFNQNGVVTYSFLPGSNNLDSCVKLFSLDSSSGWLTWKGNFEDADIKTHTCEVRASDKGTPPKSSTSRVSVELTKELALRPPSWNLINNFAIDDYDFSIAENTVFKSEIVRLSASIPYNSNLEFFLPQESIEVFNGGKRFGSNSNSSNNNGIMSIFLEKSLPEANQIPFYFLRCRAFVTSKVNPLKSIVSISRLKVKITDVNNKKPEFFGMDSNGVYTAAVTQFTKAGDFVVVVTAVDEDKTWPNNKITYSLEDGGGSEYFNIKSDNGEVKVATSATPTTGNTIFNPNQKAFYEIMVVAQDGAPSALPNINGPNKVKVKIQITVNGGRSTSPTFNTPFSLTILETIPRFSHVINATASFPENLFDSNTALIQYNIRGGNDGRVFAVNISTGSIYKVGALNADVKSLYSLSYVVFDGIRVIGPVLVNIRVKRDTFRPVIFDSNIYNYVGPALTEKDDSSIGTTLATVITKPTNNNQQIQYFLTDPIKYTIDQSGVVKLNQALSRDVPDGFAPQQVNVIARAGNYSPGYSLVNLQLNDINDNKPLFDVNSGFVRENFMGDAFNLKSFDADAGVNREVVFEMVDDDDNFDVTSDGLMTTKKTLNFEEKQKYNVKVRARDKGTRSLSSESDIHIYISDVSEFPPSFSQALYEVNINEELPVGGIVTSVKADDADPMDNLTYSISTSSADDFFFVENVRVFDGSYEDNTASIVSTGVIRMNKRLDFDALQQRSYELTLKTVDSGRMEAYTVVKVTIEDVNDNPPSIIPSSTSTTLSANDVVGKEVTSFSASDLDSGLNGEYSFQIDHKESDKMFHFDIGAQDGKVKIVKAFNADTPSNIILSILAVDEGSNPMTGTASLNITITDIQRLPPLPLLNQYPIVIPPTAVKNSQIYCLNNNNNNNNNNNYNYELDCEGVANCDDFNINQRGCLLANRDGFSRKELPYNNYNVPVKISNKKDPQLVTRQIVRLVMQGTTDTKPQEATKTVQVVNFVDAEGGYSSIPLGNVYVEDVDDWDLHLKSFRLLSTHPYISLDEDNNGMMLLRGDVRPGDYESQVKVKDASFTAVSANVKVNVVIVNQTVLNNAASMRIKGLTDVTDLLRVPDGKDGKRIDIITNLLASNLPAASSVIVLSMTNFQVIDDDDDVTMVAAKQRVRSGGESWVDVLYAAKSDSVFYTPQLLNSIVNENKLKIEEEADLSILMAPIDMCRWEFYNCWKDGCLTHMNNLHKQPRLININQTSFVGLNIDFEQKCVGEIVDEVGVVEKDGVVLCVEGFCLNSGKCTVNNTVAICECGEGYDGSRCEVTKVSFIEEGGYLLLPSLPQSLPFHLSLELFIPPFSPSTITILYSGPTQQPTPSSNIIINNFKDTQTKDFISKDFLLLELSNGKPKLRLDFGDGEMEVALLAKEVQSLNDQKWHALDVFIQHQSVTLMIDNCIDAKIYENISSSVMDTSACKITFKRSSERFLINTASFPLQLGGRMDSSNTYPLNWVKESLRGCVRNLNVNSKLYDLSLGMKRKFQSAESSCRYEDCTSCAAGATCAVLGPPGTATCQCPPGFQGTQCQTPTTTRYFEADGFVKWTPSPSFIKQANDSLNWYSDTFQLLFRTRQLDGVLFTVQSFTNLERYILQLIDGVPYFKYDLGSNDEMISLNEVKVNDGSWHWIRAERHGNKVELRLDDGTGAKYNSTFPTNKHRYIKLFSANILADLSYNEWTKKTDSENNLDKTCISDVRYNGNSLPLTTTEASPFFDVTSEGGSEEGCDLSGVCDEVNCPSGLKCVDLWQKSVCRCETFYPPGSSHVSTQDCISQSCFKSPCLNGATCTVVNGEVMCVCATGYSGLSCEVKDVPKGGSTSRNFNLVAVIILPILLILLCLCVLIFLIWWCCCRDHKNGLLDEEPDKDIRENVITYDDEGAGEEDNYAFDLGRLKKANMETENVKKSIDFDHIVPTLTASNQYNPTTTLPIPHSNIGDFIEDRMKDIDKDNFNDDTQTQFDFEGVGSEAGTLSTLASSQGDKDVDLDWLENAGEGFGKLADMYS